MESKYQTPSWVRETQKMKYGLELGRELTAEDKHIIDLDGTYDEHGNKYGVVWTILGAPLSTKINSQDGRKYVQLNRGGKYYFQIGCCESLEMD